MNGELLLQQKSAKNIAPLWLRLNRCGYFNLPIFNSGPNRHFFSECRHYFSLGLCQRTLFQQIFQQGIAEKNNQHHHQHINRQ